MAYIRLDKKILDWEWYKNEHTKSIFLHCLLKANWKEGRFEGKSVPRGSFITSIKKLSLELDLTEDEVRTALSHLLKTGEVTKQTTNKYTVISVSNYELYQEVPKQIPNNSQTDTEQIPNKSQPIPNLFPTIEEIEEEKEREKDNKGNMCKADALALFEKLWKLYPVKKGKGQVSLAAKQRLLKVGYDEMARAIDRYNAELEKDSDWRKPQNGSTFFNSGYVDYLDANYVPSKGHSGKGKNPFNSYPQRERTAQEMSDLEKALLGRGGT